MMEDLVKNSKKCGLIRSIADYDAALIAGADCRVQSKGASTIQLTALLPCHFGRNKFSFSGSSV